MENVYLTKQPNKSYNQNRSILLSARTEIRLPTPWDSVSAQNHLRSENNEPQGLKTGGAEDPSLSLP